MAVLPLPLTAVALFSYGILRSLGYINERTRSRFVRRRSAFCGLFGCKGRIIYLQSIKLYPKVLEIVNLHGGWRHKRILEFGESGGNPETKTTYARLTSVLEKLDTGGSRQAIGSVHDLFGVLFRQGLDIWQSRDTLEAFVRRLEFLYVPSSVIRIAPRGQKTFSMPVFQENARTKTDDDVTGSFSAALDFGRICELQDKNIVLAVVGPSSSGKSTVTPAIVSQMQDWVTDLKSIESFSGLEMSVGLVDLDLATPTAGPIAEGWGWDRERVASLKRPWTIELAEEAEVILSDARARYNIAVADLPGGEIDGITELLAANADAAIVISHDWDITGTGWVSFLKYSGVPVVSRIRSRAKNEAGGYSSLVTSRDEGKHLSGRVVSLNRSHKTYDAFITWLVPFLLFDILPSRFSKGT